jgi:hypothetical protein
MDSMTLKQLAIQFGYTDILTACEVEGWAFDSVVPGLCRIKGCQYYADVEPDAQGYDCDEHPGMIDSVLVRMGLI